MARARRLLIIGAGPIGLEAALYAAHLGYEVRVLEGGRVGENVLSWGHVRMFSPWGMNCSSLGLAVVSRERARPYLDGRAAPTGREYVARYLRPLRASRLLRGVIRERTRVVAISRRATAKQDLPGDPARALRPFRVLAARGGREEIHEADLVIDATGTYGQARPLGNGGIAAPGEKAAGPLIDRGIPDLAHARVADRFAGRKILLVGAGHSAATSAIGLASLAARHPRTRVLWIFRGTRTPLYSRVVQDALPQRDILCAEANRLARRTHPRIEPCPGSLVESIARVRRNGGGRIRVNLERDGLVRRVMVIRDARDRGAEALFCLGDLGGFGPHPDRVPPSSRSTV